MKVTKGETNISTYHEYMNEGAYSLRSAHTLLVKVKEMDKGGIDSTGSRTSADLQSRYAFLMFANALEAAANALLLELHLPDESYKELEKLNTLSKIFLFSDIKGCPADRGNHLINFIKEIINCRNEFVHPKPSMVEVDLSEAKPVLLTKKTKSKNYPLYFTEINFDHAIEALKDILSFLSWIVFDTCKYKLEEGAWAIGFNAYGSTGDIEIIGAESGIKFDLRTFSKE